MLLNSSISLGVYCDKCGHYEMFDISIFSLSKDKTAKIESTCSDNYITVRTYDYKSFYFSVYCSSCNTRHIYKYTLSDILKGINREFKCDLTQLSILYIGERSKVEKYVEKSNKELDDIILKCGFDSHINNPYIMMKVLDKIHEIAEKGNLYCDCGCRDIDVSLFSDRVELKCMKCGSLNIVYAENIQDYENVANRERIVLHERSFTCLDSIFFK